MERGRQKGREREGSGGDTSGWRTTEFMIPEVFTVQGSMTAHLHTHYIVWCMMWPKEIRQLNVCDSLIFFFFVFVFPSRQKWWWCVCNSWYCWGGNVHGLNRMWHKALHNLWWTVTPAFPHIVTWLFIHMNWEILLKKQALFLSTFPMSLIGQIILWSRGFICILSYTESFGEFWNGHQLKHWSYLRWSYHPHISIYHIWLRHECKPKINELDARNHILQMSRVIKANKVLKKECEERKQPDIFKNIKLKKNSSRQNAQYNILKLASGGLWL